MARRYFEELKKYYSDYKIKQILDAIFAGFLFSALVFVPIYLILTEIMIVYVYLYYEITALFVLAAGGHMVLWHQFAKQSLEKKNPGHISDIKYLFLYSELFFGLLILVIGLVIIFVMLPIWMV